MGEHGVGVHKHISPCTCAGTCSVQIVAEFEPYGDDPEEWFIEHYQHIGAVPGWRARARVAWGVLRGRDPWTHGVSLDAAEARALRDFMVERTGRTDPAD